MPKYMIPVDVTAAHGHQTFSVVADSPEEAIGVFKNGGGEFEEEEIEVLNLATESIAVSDIWIKEDD